MSANNWRKCPRCEANATAAHLAALKKAEAKYGKVPAAEYVRLLKEAKEAPESADSLREDWHLGIYKGKFEVGYRALCVDCGFEFSYDHKEQVFPKETP